MLDLKLHHAIKYASFAAEQISSAAWAAGTPELEDQAIAIARDYLAKATENLNAYDAKRLRAQKTTLVGAA